MKILTDADIERRCRYRLALHDTRMHKVKNNNGASYYYLYQVDEDDSRPEDDNSYMNLETLLKYCEKLAEDDANARAERRA